MSKFKEGDKVVCINDNGAMSKLKVGNIFTIKEILYGSECLVVESSNIGWASNRFKLYVYKRKLRKLCI